MSVIGISIQISLTLFNVYTLQHARFQTTPRRSPLYSCMHGFQTSGSLIQIFEFNFTLIMTSPSLIHPHRLLFAEAIVDNHDKLLSELKEQYLEGREFIINALAENGYETLPSQGCYVCIKPKHRTSRELTDLLEEENILILCGKDGLTGWLRLTIAHKKYMEIFMETLLKIDKE